MTTIPSRGLVPLAAVIILVAFNLRPSLTSLAPVLNEVMADTGLSASGASIMTTLPVLCLGLFASVAPGLGRRIGVERAVLAVLAAIAAGALLRGAGSVIALLAGSLLAGAGIGIGNVLIPAMLKRDFSSRAPLMTGIYTTALGIGATIASGATVPIYHATGDSWRAALTVWAIPALLAMVVAAAVWAPNLRQRHRLVVRVASTTSLWRSPLAWQVTLFMGLQSTLAYSLFGWLAPILRSRGDSAVTAGLVVSVSVLSQMAASLPAPLLAARLRQQSWPCVICMTGSAGGFLGLIVAPMSLQWLFAVITGLGMGGSFALAVLLMVLRTPNAAAASRLSSMAQSVGYSLAAAGPLLVGVLHDYTGDWSGAVALLLVAGTLASVAGYLAGRNRLVPG